MPMNEPTRKEKHLDDLTREVSASTDLREGPAGVETVLRVLYQAEPAGIKSLARKARLPVPVLVAVLGELAKHGLVQRGKGVSLTARGRLFVQEELGIFSGEDWSCNTCHGRTIFIPARLRPVAEKLAFYARQAPGVDTALDQAPSTPESSLRRALFMIQQGAVEGKRLAILGDDDSISLAIGLLGRALHPDGAFAARLTVLESDPRWVEHLRRAAQQEKLDLEARQVDLREPLPAGLHGAFDTFETDPPYTLPGMALFVSRGVEALQQGAGRQGFLSLGARPPDEMLAFQRALSDMGLAIAQLLPNFNVYQGASLLAGTSHLFHLLATNETRPLLPETLQPENIYTGGQNPTLRLYRCMACGREYEIGQGRPYPTIEKLKDAGCETCGGESFTLQGRLL